MWFGSNDASSVNKNWQQCDSIICFPQICTFHFKRFNTQEKRCQDVREHHEDMSEILSPDTAMEQVYAKMSFSRSCWVNNMFLNPFPGSPQNQPVYCNFVNVRKANGRCHFILKVSCWVFIDSSKGYSRRCNCCCLWAEWISAKKNKTKQSLCHHPPCFMTTRSAVSHALY